jgi:uncharacterized membrane protein
MFKKIGTYFLQGVLFTVPLAVTLYVIFALLGFIDDILPTILPFKIDIPGLGLVILLVMITVIGFLGNTVIANPINYWFKRLLNKAPVIKSIYTSIMDFTEAIVGGKKKKFSKPVLVKLSPDVEKPGFITQSDLSSWGIGEEKVMVYLPHSYGFTGNIFIVPKKNVSPLKVKSAEMMKIILSGGVAESQSEE